MLTSRRSFVLAATTALVSPSLAWTTESVPRDLDHIILECSDLDRGIHFLTERLGVTAVFSGVHPGRGTRNALLSLGGKRYLEVLAPDPAQASHPVHRELKQRQVPRLGGWAVHVNATEMAERLRKAKIEFEGPTDGSRKRPDNRILRWRTLNLKNDHEGLLPFFIEWSADSLHPSSDSPAGCTLTDFDIATPDPVSIARVLSADAINANVRRAGKAGLHARIQSPKRTVELA